MLTSFILRMAKTLCATPQDFAVSMISFTVRVCNFRWYGAQIGISVAYIKAHAS